MAFAFNPLTGNFDLKGSGGGGGSAFFAGEVATYADLPLDGTAALNSRWLVRSNSGTWPFSSYKQAGVYVRKAIVGASRDNDYQLTDTSFFDVMSDDKFLVFDNSDATKALAFDVGTNVPTSSTVTLTVPAASGTIARTETFAAPPAIGGTTAAAGTFTTLTANNGTLTGASAPVLDLAQTWNNAATIFTGLRFNVTNTASNANSLSFDLQTGGSSVFNVRRDGTTGGALFAIGTSWLGNTLYSGGVMVTSGSEVAWANSSTSVYTTLDVRLARDAAGVLAQRRGTNSQEYRLYGTYTSDSNYQRMTIKSVRQTLSALSGASATTTGTFIPDGAVVVGVTTRVSTLLTGATGYTIGDGTDADRWGDITGTAVGTTSDNRDWTAGTIECFTAGGNITLTAKTANFTAGAIEISVFYLAGEAD
jgi:hypothetical protein